MTNLEVLDRDIRGLKELLRVARRELASPSLTAHERCEVRNEMKRVSAELRRFLQMLEVEHSDLRKRSAQEHNACGFEKPQLQLLLGAYGAENQEMN